MTPRQLRGCHKNKTKKKINKQNKATNKNNNKNDSIKYTTQKLEGFELGSFAKKEDSPCFKV